MALKPVVVIGREGPSERVIKATDVALARHGLIKIRLEAPDRATRTEWLESVVQACEATLCGLVGHTASLYRPNASKDTPQPETR